MEFANLDEYVGQPVVIVTRDGQNRAGTLLSAINGQLQLDTGEADPEIAEEAASGTFEEPAPGTAQTPADSEGAPLGQTTCVFDLKAVSVLYRLGHITSFKRKFNPSLGRMQLIGFIDNHYIFFTFDAEDSERIEHDRPLSTHDWLVRYTLAENDKGQYATHVVAWSVEPRAPAVNQDSSAGWITFYHQGRGYGFIDGSIYFLTANVRNLQAFAPLDTFSKRYPVTYQALDSTYRPGKKMADQIVIQGVEALASEEVRPAESVAAHAVEPVAARPAEPAAAHAAEPVAAQPDEPAAPRRQPAPAQTLDDEACLSIYVFLMNKFKPDMQFPMTTVLRELNYAGFRKEKFGFREGRAFLEQLARFITIEEAVFSGAPQLLVSIHRVPEWETDALDEAGRGKDSASGDFENHTTPGINPGATLDHFNPEEQRIVRAFADVFYVTHGGSTVRLGASSTYRYCLIKPTAFISEQFRLYREIILVFSDFSVFEPRSLDAIGEITSRICARSSLRLERICSVMISRDARIASKLKDLLKTNAEQMHVIIPFSYEEALAQSASRSPNAWREFVIQRFRDHFYERDLFSFHAPLQKDLYFFGRQNYVQELVNRSLSHENSGVFGLRRSGKTSILYAIQRTMDRLGRRWLLVDGERLQHMRWNQALHYLAGSAFDRFGLASAHTHTQADYTPSSAAVFFEQDMQAISQLIDGESLLILFDEIEHITFDIALSSHWRSGEDFIYFWGAIRSHFQKHPDKLTFIIAGTNPKAIEAPLVNGYANPLYQQMTTGLYLPLFSISETTDMVNKLGGYMGLHFDDLVCPLLTQDFGGQPFLIRQFCSRINAFIAEKGLSRPRTVTKTIYDQVKPAFEETDLHAYCDMILDVLKRNYPEELRMLECIALDDQEALAGQAENPAITAHLVGYGLIERIDGLYGFRNEAVRKHLVDKNQYRRILRSDEEKWLEISKRRNRAETQLRKIVRVQLKSHLGEEGARRAVLDSLRAMNRHRDAYDSLTYSELFSQKTCELYWSQVINLVFSNWRPCFENLFTDRALFKAYGTIINNLRSDAHAYEVSDDEMLSFRGAMSWLEAQLGEL